MKKIILRLTLFCVFVTGVNAQVTATIGTGSTSSTSYGPVYRTSAGSGFDFSRYHYIYTASELSAAGISSGTSISEIKWYLNSTSVMSGTGNATLKIYFKNSSATVATTNTWANLIDGSTQVFNGVYNTTTNFPGVVGWMPFTLNSAFIYTGGSLEISVDWDCSAITGNPTTGGFNWLNGEAPATLSTYTNNSTLPASTTTTSTSRPNIQIVHTILNTNTFDLFGFKMYPNPTTNFITVSGLLNSEAYVIYDMMGRKLQNGILNNNDTINIENLATGKYLLQFSNGATSYILKN